MSTYEATFHADSRADAQAVQLLTERVYDALREELMESDDGPHEMLEAFETIRDATRRSGRGTLTIRYEEREDSSESIEE